MRAFVDASAVGVFAEDPIAADRIAFVEARDIVEAARQHVLERGQPAGARPDDANSATAFKIQDQSPTGDPAPPSRRTETGNLART